MKTYYNPPASEWDYISQRPSFPAEDLDEKVRAILTNVKQNGDAALREYSLKFKS